MSQSPLRAALLAALMSFACVTALAQPPADSTLASGETQAAAAAVTRDDPLPGWALPFAEMPATQRQDPVVLRVAETQIHLGEQVAYLVNRAIQVNDPGSLSQIGQYPLYFVPAYQRIRLHRVEIVRDGKTFDRTHEVRLRFAERETGLETSLYSGMVTAMLLLDDVRVGDTLHLVYTLEGRNPVFGGLYSHTIAWDNPEPVELRRATLIAPESRRIEWRMQGDYRPARIEPVDLSVPGSGWRTLRFEERAIDALDEEPSTPDDYFATRFLQLTEYSDWNTVARWATGLFPANASLPDSMQPVVERLRAIADPEARAAAALKWVQEEIRYFSVSLGESSHRPYPPADVVRRRYGDCKDKSLLLVTLLRELGIEARPVLVALDSPKTPARLLPHPDAFDHVVVQARINGREYYLDGTRLGQRGWLSRLGTMEGAQGLVVDQDTRALVTLGSPESLELATQELNENFIVDTLGSSGQLQIRRVWNGGAAELARLALQRMTPEQRRRQLMGPYERRYPGIRMAGEPRVTDDTDANRITVEALFDIPQLTHVEGEDWTLRFFPDSVAAGIRLPENFNRNFPATVATLPFRARYHLSVRWPEQVSVVREPQSRLITNAFFRAELRRAFRANVETLDLQYEPRVATVDPKDLPRLSREMQELRQTVGGVVAVARNAVKSATPSSFQDSVEAQLDKTIARATRAIEGGQLGDDDLAEALCGRAQALADRGRPAHGLRDAEEAVRVAPAAGRAYECRGQLRFANGEFALAVPDFTKALSLGQEASAVLYRRGHARFYAGDLVAAASDFGKTATLLAKAGDASRMLRAQLWQAWALQRAGQTLPRELQTTARRAPLGDWPRPALAMLTGLLSPEQLLAEVDASPPGHTRQLTRAEAWFGVGQHYLVSGDLEKARQAFEKARAESVPGIIEHLAAKFELAGSR